jgi:hypothetical protein
MWLALVLCTQDVPGSNPGPETGYPDTIILSFLRSLHQSSYQLNLSLTKPTINKKGLLVEFATGISLHWFCVTGTLLTFSKTESLSSVRSATLMSSEQVPRGMSAVAETFVVDAVLAGPDFPFLFDKPSNVLTGEYVISAADRSK